MFLEVYPNKGHRVRRPDSGAVIPESGDIVPDSVFWRRRALDGAVRLVERNAFPASLDEYPPTMRAALEGTTEPADEPAEPVDEIADGAEG